MRGEGGLALFTLRLVTARVIQILVLVLRDELASGDLRFNEQILNSVPAPPTHISSPGAAPSSRLLATTRPIGQLTYAPPMKA